MDEGRSRSIGQIRTTADVDALATMAAEETNAALLTLASAAAGGSSQALDLLLYAISSQQLAEPGIRKIIFDPNDVDDVNQNVLIAVAEHVGSFRGDSRFTSWLYGVARNKALEHLRRKKDAAEFTTDLGEVARISSMVAADVSIQQLLDGLPVHYRQAVRMRDLEGKAYQDIADELDLNLNTVRAHISRGRALLAAEANSSPPTATDG